MYLRHSTVTKNGKTHTYWRLVRSVRTGTKVRQETVLQLGELDEQGRLRAKALVQSFLGIERPPGWFDDPSSAHDVIHALTLDGVWFRDRVEWSGELTGAFNLNRYFQDDVFNLRLVIGGRARF
jgi:hypothetical protein